MKKPPLNAAATITLIALMVSSIALAQSLQFPQPKGTAVCDCKPEFNTTAEGPGTCGRAKDDTNWCKIKFNDGTGSGTAKQAEFKLAMAKSGFTYDNVQAAELINKTEPNQWGTDFLKKNLPPLVAVALWDVAPHRIKPITEIISAKEVTAQILQGWLTTTPNARALKVRNYKVISSRGCVEFADREFSLVIKTFHSSAPSGCAL